MIFSCKDARADFVLTFEQIEEILGFALRVARTVPNGGTTIRRASARSGAGHPSGRLRLAAGSRRRQGPLPEIDDNTPPR